MSNPLAFSNYYLAQWNRTIWYCSRAVRKVSGGFE